ncbi:phosphoethanolamine--lipid A transferase [Ciceribacter sp. L1K23]|uniref:phosphoethanolamine transferase n=1 Tax=Ciceribacter sp. L1K23 TaxID=2820276 RepID=UPI001B819DED|nr:phosphoethanolamine--lipid A transferase [Ciceribacter sp. L1K23]MBR0555832.1 phosphoethanolamine--lipid A transferase [Ciceribacter sp. L1K23]
MSFHFSPFRRPAIGSVPLSLATATYLLFVPNRTFWEKGLTYLGDQKLALLVLAIGLAAAFAALCVAVSVKYLTKPLFIAVILVSAAASWFTDRFGVIIDLEMIRNAAETTSAEAGNLITPAFLLHMALYGLLPSLLIVWVRIEHHDFPRKFVRNVAVIVPMLAVFAMAGLSHASIYASVTREHRDWFDTLNPIIPLVNAALYVSASQNERDIVAAPLGTDARVVETSTTSRKPRVTILVVGETARAANFSLGGYARETTPELQARDVVYFSDTSSCGTATAVSLPCMFSDLTRATYSHAKGLARENLVDVLGHAGVKVEWWDNDTGSKRVASRIGERKFFGLNDPEHCEDGECRDTVMLNELDGWLDSVKGDSVLVLHQIGSHGPAYYKRYPEAYRRFVPDCRSAEFSQCSRQEIVNAYDNTIAYTDHVVATVIDQLAARQDRIDPAMIYVSDHGESLGEYGLYLHGAPYMIAPPEQTHVPFLLWLGDEAKASLDPACLAAEAARPQSHDNFFHTVLGLMQVETKELRSDLDLVGACRRMAGA